MKKICYGIISSSILLFLLLFPSQALLASKSGLHLWFDILIPSLFPFLLLSDFLISAGLVQPVVSLLSPFFSRFLGLSPEGTYTFLMGFLCGYPMGAKISSDLVARGQLSFQEAAYLLGFCNNVSPAFLITFLVTQQLKAPSLMFPTLLILYSAPLTYALLTNPSYRRLKKTHPFSSCPTDSSAKESLSFSMIDQCIFRSVQTIVKLGGYVILFSLLSSMTALFPLPEFLKALFSALFEITNGTPSILSSLPEPYAYLSLMVCISFGGLSALAQTNSVIKNAHLSLGNYVRSKIIISILSFLYALLFFLGECLHF